MYARVLRTDLKKATIDGAAAEWKSHTEHYKKIGMKKAFMLADRESGKFLSITLWENEKALQKNSNSPEQAAGRKYMTEKYFEAAPSSEAFEIVGIIE
jgi:heme-degrading monooxygenase HmoA